jgi:hypothetical protein
MNNSKPVPFEAELIVAFQPVVKVTLSGEGDLFVNGSEKIDRILKSFEATINKLLKIDDSDNLQISELERYFVVHTKKNIEELRDILLKESVVEVAYIKPLAEDPGF